MAKNTNIIGTPLPASKLPNSKNPAWVKEGPAQPTLPKSPYNKAIAAKVKIPMTPDQIAKRKRSTVSNAATKVMGGLYSK